MTIQKEQPENLAGIYAVVEQAFGGAAEADLVNLLRENGKAVISLVATADERIVGHILFSPVSLESCSQPTAVIGLAPLAVLPELQKRGIGSRLTEAGLEECRRLGYDAVVVLGHPDYYPRFGFVPAVQYGLKSEYDVADEAFMILELREGALAGCSGTVKYQPEFAQVS